MDIKILIGITKFYDWDDYIILLQKIFPKNIVLADFEKDDIIKIIDLFNVNYILSLTYNDMKIISNINPKNCLILNNKNYNNIELFDNKCKFTEYFIENNLEKYIPKSFQIKYEDFVFNKKIIYPVIMKSNIGLGGNDVFILHCENDYNKKYKILKNNFVVQEYLIDDVEYVGHLFYIEGKLIYSLFFKIFNDNIFFVRKGPSKKYILVDFNHLIFDEIFKNINFSGPLNINFKFINGEIKIFEVNPRFGGSFIKSSYLYDLFNSLINYLKYH
jgi:hypothetical protein